jgi:hypothetical protein
VTAAAPAYQGGLLTYGSPLISAPVLFDPQARVTLTGISTTAANTTVNVASTTGLVTGMLVSGPGIPAGATVAGVTNCTSFTINVGASQTVSGASGSAVYTTGTATSGVGLVYTGGDDGVVARWRGADLAPAPGGGLLGHAAPVRALAAGAGGTLVSGDGGGSVCVWQL